MLTLLLALAQTAPSVDGTLLKPGTACYAIARGEQALGVARHSVTATTVDGVPAWDVVIHQWISGGKFDIRDHFVLRRKDLSPVTFDSRKSGVEHVRVDYSGPRPVMTKTGAEPQEVATSGPVWEGNLWGLTIAALPLAEGAHFEVPVYHYDQGLGRFLLDVVGTEKVGEEDAWIVEASRDGVRKVRYLVGKTSRAELGYYGSGFAQRPGGDCSGIGA